MIGINILVDMLMLKSETLQYIAGMAIIALTTENIENQNKIVAGGGVQPLVRLLRSAKTSEKVLVYVITPVSNFPNYRKQQPETDWLMARATSLVSLLFSENSLNRLVVIPTGFSQQMVTPMHKFVNTKRGASRDPLVKLLQNLLLH